MDEKSRCCGRVDCGEDRRGGAMRGLLEPAILAALGARPGHGYELRASLDASTAGLLEVDPGGLYRILRRMEGDGLVASAWETGDHGPQRRTYRLTEKGVGELRCWIERLGARRAVIDGITASASVVLAGARPQSREATRAVHEHLR